MAKSKSQERRKKVSKDNAKSDLVSCLEHMTGESLDITGDNGLGRMVAVKRALNAKGFDLTIVEISDGEQLLVVAVTGQPRFKTVIRDKKEITFDPSGEVPVRGKYREIVAYKVTKIDAQQSTDSEA